MIYIYFVFIFIVYCTYSSVGNASFKRFTIKKLEGTVAKENSVSGEKKKIIKLQKNNII